jgi:hypothetical protein
MNHKRRTARRLTSTLGLALMAMLALSAITAGAAQATDGDWHIGGKTLKERGIPVEGGETFSSSGSFSFEIATYKARFINCKETGKGEIIRPRRLEEQITLSGCVQENVPSCTLQPFTINTYGAMFGITSEPGRWGRAEGVGSPFATIYASSGGCFFSAETNLTPEGPGFSFAFGPEAQALSVSTSGMLGRILKQTVIWSGSSTWQLTGPNMGQKVGFY